MEAQKLFLANGKEIAPHICGKCGRIWESADSAQRCCKCSYCGEFCDWRKSVSHDACQTKAFRDGETRAIESAILVPDYDGPFLWADRVHMDVEDLLEYVELEDIPDFGFCTQYQAPVLKLSTIMEIIADTMHDEWEAEDVPELEAAIEAWNEANKANGTYWEDRKRKWSKADIVKRGGEIAGCKHSGEWA